MLRWPPLIARLTIAVACCVLASMTGVAFAADSGSANPSSAADAYHSLQPFLQTYCTDCHGGETPEAKVRMDFRDEELNLNEQHNLWRVVLEKIRLREMPPESEPQPTEGERTEASNGLNNSFGRSTAERSAARARSPSGV